MLKVRSKSLHEFFQQSDYFFNDPVSFSADELKKNEEIKKVKKTNKQPKKTKKIRKK